MPSSTDAQIAELIAKIRALCAAPFSPKAEADLRNLAKELRTAIRQHVTMAKSSLGTKKAAIDEHDPERQDENT